MLDDASDQSVAPSFFGGEPEKLRRVSSSIRSSAARSAARRRGFSRSRILEDLARLDLDGARGAAGAARRLCSRKRVFGRQ